MTSTKQLAIRGAIWTIGGYGIGQILRFGSNLILTRLLAPELFGLMSLVMVFIVGLHLFSDIGLGPSIIQNKRGDDPTFLNTAWTMQIIRSGIIWLCCVLIAFPIAHLYAEPNLAWLIPVVGLNTVIGGFNSTALFTLNRRMEISQLAIFELGSQFVSIAVLLIWAWFNPTIWALVVGGLVSAFVSLAWSHFLNRNLLGNKFCWDPEAAREIFAFGKWIFLATAVTFLSEQVDKLMLGKMISFQLLGVYNIAFVLSDIPRQILLAVSSKVLFPAFSKLSDLPREDFSTKILKNRLPLLLGVAIALSLLVSFGDLLISMLYDRRYAAASWMLPILAVGIWPRVLTQTIDQALLAVSKSRYASYGSFLKFLFMIIALPIGFHMAGLPGAIIVIAMNDIPFYVAIAYGLWQEKLSSLYQDFQVTLLFILLCSAMITARALLGFGTPIHTLV